jgi:hypothetical protein
VLREWNKGKDYSATAAGRYAAKLWIIGRFRFAKPPKFRDFFPRRHAMAKVTVDGCCALGNQKALLVKLGRLF